MELLYFFIICIILIWGMLFFINEKFLLNKANIQIFPFILIMKSQKFLTKIENFGIAHRRLHDKFGTLLLFLTFLLFFGTPIFLFANIFLSNSSLISIVPIFNLEIETIIIILVGLVPAIFIHEFAHAIIMVVQKIKVKFYGFLIIGVIPIFFVYPKEKSYSEALRIQKLKISTAGIGANLLAVLFTSFIVLSLPLVLSSVYLQKEGAWVVSVENESLAFFGGIVENDIILNLETINASNKSINSYQIATKHELINSLETINPGTKLRITTARSFHIIQTNSNSETIQLGIVVDDYYSSKLTVFPMQFPYYLRLTLNWFININLSIATFNLIPVSITDGGKFVDALIQNFYGNRKRFAKIILKYFYTIIFLSGIGANLLIK